MTYLDPLDREALRQILTEPKNSIIKQYIKMFEIDGIHLSFDKEALDFMVDKSIEFKLGARGLRSIVEAIMIDAMFELPSTDCKELHISPGICRRKNEKSKYAHITLKIYEEKICIVRQNL